MGERKSFPAGHVMHMTLDHSDRAQSISVASCDCRWEHRAPWPGDQSGQDAAVENHWREIESLT